MKHVTKMMLVVAVLAMVAVTAQAAVITPTDVSAPTVNAAWFSAVNAINGNGLDGVGNVEDQLHRASDHSLNDHWQQNSTSSFSAITFDLGSAMDVGAAYVWNCALWDGAGDQTGRGVQNTTIEVSTDGVNFASLGTFTFAQASLASSSDSIAAEIVNFDSIQTDVRYVKFGITSNYGDSARTGLSEVRFDTVPEPATMTLLGLGGLLALVRRRRK